MKKNNVTCIVGLIDKGKVYIGGDSAGVSGLDITLRKDVKVFKNGDFVIGCTSSFRMIQLLRFSFTPPKDSKADIYEYMCTDFIDAVRKCFKDGGYGGSDTTSGEVGGTFLVGYKGRLFQIYDDYQVAESAEIFDSCGCGATYALGTFFAIHKNKSISAKDKIIKALESAVHFSGGVRPPFVIESI